MSALDITVEHGDLFDLRADVMVLKHACGFHGADQLVSDKLVLAGAARSAMEMLPGAHTVLDTRGQLAAPKVLFLGTVQLGSLGYHEVRQFAARTLAALEPLPVKHVGCTAHGTNYGLDEDEAVLALVGGFIEAFQRGVGSATLERITVVERNAGRAQRLRRALERGLDGTPGVTRMATGWGFHVQRMTSFVATRALATAGTQVDKPHAFVAMPFSPEFEDVFHYGIQQPVKNAGLLCERVDQGVFDGLIIARIRERIETASVVIADLSGANANVYLEVGYAWGCGRPTILLTRDVKELKFDVSAYRCLVYGTIRELEQVLTRELQHVASVPKL